MKKNLVLLGMVAAFVTPCFSLRADDAVQSKKTVGSKANAMHTASAKRTPADSHPNRETFYVTNRIVTGSNIPVVVTRYHGHNVTSSPLISYDQTDITTTGALNVGGALVTRDPAISYGRGR